MEKSRNKSAERWKRSAEALKKNLQRRKVRKKNKELHRISDLNETDVASSNKMEMLKY